MTPTIQYRQGDVLLEKISCLPDHPMIQLSSLIVARGEISNHAHAIIGNASLLESKENNLLYVQVKIKAKLEHVLETSLTSAIPQWTGEHKEIELEEGVYQVIHQQEYDPYKDVIRRVWD